ncbi:MAG TPA: hypothetical protein VIK52_01225 [Opitutaceae bacterium]
MGYKVIRSTVVLAMHSNALAQVRTPDLDRVLGRVEEVNYDLARLEDLDLEVLYAAFDELFAERVKNEFEFLTDIGSVIVHDVRAGICILCGKGASKDTGDNKDHIRFEFKLTNIAGGRDVWCGSTCIINFGLKVRGAETAEQALELLQKSMRGALRQWVIRQWQAEHPDHAEMPEQYREACRRYGALQMHRDRVPLTILGIADDIGNLRSTVHGLKLATRHYQRHAYLPPKKSAAWMKAKEASRAITVGSEVIAVMRNLPTPQSRLDFLLAAADLFGTTTTTENSTEENAHG